MNCRKRKYNPEDLLNKITGNEPLDHCEELFYLVHVLHLPEKEAEDMLYGNDDKPAKTERR